MGISALFTPWLLVSVNGSEPTSIGLSPLDSLWGAVSHTTSNVSGDSVGVSETDIQGNLVAKLGFGSSLLGVGGILLVLGSFFSLFSFRWKIGGRIGGFVMLAGLITGSIGWLAASNRAQIVEAILSIGPSFGQGLAGIGTILTISSNVLKARNPAPSPEP